MKEGRERSLAEANPKLAAEWHPTLNGSLTPADVAPSSSRKVWWLGPCGHEWETSVGTRRRGSRCPFCYGRRVKEGFNDLATTHPRLAAEWHPEKNGGLEPTDIKAGSQRRVWWKCSVCGHEWQTIAAARRNGGGCSYCAGTKARPGENDLATTHPAVAAMWHPERNPFGPDRIKAGSDRKAWWKCPVCGHEWQTRVYRMTHGAKCPGCSGTVEAVARREAARREKERLLLAGVRGRGEWWRFELSRTAGGAVETDFAVCKAPDAASAHAQIAHMADAGWAVVAVRRAATFGEASVREGGGDGR